MIFKVVCKSHLMEVLPSLSTGNRLTLGVLLHILDTATQYNVHEPYGVSLPSLLPFLLSYIVFCSQPLGTFSSSPLGSRQPR